MRPLLPLAFAARMRALLNNEFEAFSDALTQQKFLTAIRLNPVKLPHPVFEGAQPVAWCENGFFLPKRPDFVANPLWHAGVYYSQEASSMFVAEAVRQCCNLAEPALALDMCAAPGGKTTLLAATLHPNSLLVANEVIKTRVPVLLENVQKWGMPNIWVTNNDPADFTPFNEFFDLVLTDAPCSGEGLFRKTPDAIQEWSEQNVQLCSARQRRILANVADLVKPGGTLLYTTCTYAPQENEQNMEWLVSTGNFTSIRLQLPAQWGITETALTAKNGQTVFGYRFYPHKTPGEGFFISCLRKNGKPKAATSHKTAGKKMPQQPFLPTNKRELPLLEKWLKTPKEFTFFTKSSIHVFAVPVTYAAILPFLATHLIVKSAGVEMGIIKGKELVPAPALALSNQISEKIPVLELEQEQALAYLKKQSFELQYPNDLQGWVLVSYQQHALGWVKLMPQRWNNYFPTEWRIRK